jgi:hypothetical protein
MEHLVKCSECKYLLSNPIVLPCGNTVCLKHIPQQAQHIYDCHSCKIGHEVPDNGFASNKLASQLIDQYFGQYKRALASCESLKSTIDELESLKKNPQSHINEKVDKLMNKIESWRDLLIVQIRENSEQILTDMETYKRECLKSLSRLDDTINLVETKLAKKKVKLSRFFDDLNTWEVDKEAKWQTILEKSQSDANELATLMTRIKGFFLLNKFDEIKEKEIKFCQLRIDPEIKERLKFLIYIIGCVRSLFYK